MRTSNPACPVNLSPPSPLSSSPSNVVARDEVCGAGRATTGGGRARWHWLSGCTQTRADHLSTEALCNKRPFVVGGQQQLMDASNLMIYRASLFAVPEFACGLDAEGGES